MLDSEFQIWLFKFILFKSTLVCKGDATGSKLPYSWNSFSYKIAPVGVAHYSLWFSVSIKIGKERFFINPNGYLSNFIKKASINHIVESYEPNRYTKPLNLITFSILIAVKVSKPIWNEITLNLT